jgi:hypothetical protein
MKTTVELPDQLAREAKAFAREHGVTLRELIERGLRAELARAEVKDGEVVLTPSNELWLMLCDDVSLVTLPDPDDGE